MLRFPPRNHPAVTIHLTALIDIVFLLLIYFLLTSNFLMQDSIAINLPEVDSIGSYDEHLIRITVDRVGFFYWKEKKVSDGELISHLRAELSLSSTKQVLVKADRDVPLKRVVTVMDIAKKYGAQSLMLATEMKAQKK
jgi:biopolymer transport protein ExbD